MGKYYLYNKTNCRFIMKGSLKSFALNISVAFSAMLILCGCPVAMDYLPVELAIFVNDSNGNDLLDPDNPDNFAQGLKFEYNGTVYNVDDQIEELRTKTYMPHFDGLRLIKNTYHYTKNKGRYFLSFGEFSGEKTFDGTFRITWKDNSTDVITCYNKKYNKKGKCTLNGESYKTTHPYFIIELVK